MLGAASDEYRRGMHMRTELPTQLNNQARCRGAVVSESVGTIQNRCGNRISFPAYTQ